MTPAKAAIILVRRLTRRIAMPVENLIMLFIIIGGMAVFMLVTMWFSLDRNKLPRDSHSGKE